MAAVAFLDETELCERAVRRLARSRSTTVTRSGDVWLYNGVELDGDEVWDVLSDLPITNATPFGRL